MGAVADTGADRLWAGSAGWGADHEWVAPNGVPVPLLPVALEDPVAALSQAAGLLSGLLDQLTALPGAVEELRPAYEELLAQARQAGIDVEDLEPAALDGRAVAALVERVGVLRAQVRVAQVPPEPVLVSMQLDLVRALTGRVQAVLAEVGALTEPTRAALAWTEKVLARTARRGTSGLVHVVHPEYWAELSGRARALLEGAPEQVQTLLGALEDLAQLVDNIDEGIARWGGARRAGAWGMRNGH